MLSILLSAADGGTAWRQALAPGEARAGWECAGPLGLARRIGRILGHPSEPARAPDRVAALASRLSRCDDGNRSYSRSRRSDPFGVASFLLLLRDRLRLAGWSGQPLAGSARLADLAALEALREPLLPPGLPDLLEGLATAVDRAGKLPLALSVDLAAPRPAYSPRLLRLLGALERAGARVAEAAPDSALASAGTDLGRLQRALLDPGSPPARLSGDGSFLLLEADTPVEAAEMAAGLLRRWPLEDATAVVAAGAEVLDAALARQGLPTLGLAQPSALRPHSQFLPLRLALAFPPPDPFGAAELLLLPGAPLPGQARARLLGALSEMPGIGSPAWREAIEAAAAEEQRRSPADPGAGAALRERIEAWFGSGGEELVPGQGILPARAAALCGMVAGWARARAGGEEKGGDGLGAGLWAHAASVARTLERTLLALPPDRPLTELALAQLHGVAAGSGAEVAPFTAEAGRPAVCGGPADVLPAPGSVLWFGFVKDAGPGPAPEPWTEAERAALLEAWVQVAGDGEARRNEAWGWRRPLLLAREQVALVRWRLQGAEPIGPHALAEELRTRAAPLEACTLGSERLLGAGSSALAPPTAELPPAPAIAPHPVFHVAPAALEPRGPLSATAIEALIACPFRWALEQQAQLRPGRAADLPDGSRLLGSFAHRILQDLLLGEGALDPARASPEEGRAWALRAFDGRVSSEAAPLARPGNGVALAAARSLVGGAAAALLQHLRSGGWTPRAAEEEVEGTFAGLPLRGRIDLVLEKKGRPGLLDLKLSGRKYRREELEQGKGLQIALYSSMLRRGRELPPAGFLILADGDLLTLSPGDFPGATAVEGPSARETLKAAEETFVSWRRVLARGVLPLCAEDLPWEGPVADAGGTGLVEEGALPAALREGACSFCRFTTLCRARVDGGPPP